MESSPLRLPTEVGRSIDFNTLNSVKFEDIFGDQTPELILANRGNLVSFDFERYEAKTKNFAPKNENSALGPITIDLSKFPGELDDRKQHVLVVDSNMVPHVWDENENKVELKHHFKPQVIRHRQKRFSRELSYAIGNFGDPDLDLALVHEESVYVLDLPFLGPLSPSKALAKSAKLMDLLKLNFGDEYNYVVWGVVKNSKDNKPIEGAKIALSDAEGEPLAQNITSKEGIVFFGVRDPGVYFFTYIGEKWPFLAQELKTTVIHDTPHSGEIIYLDPKEKVTIFGTVIDSETKDPISGVEVLSNEESSADGAISQELFGKTNKKGEFLFQVEKELAEKIFSLLTFKHRNYQLYHTIFEVDKESLVELKPSRIQDFTVFIINEKGENIKNAKVQVFETVFDRPIPMMKAQSDREGKIVLKGIKRASHYFLEISHPHYSRKKVHIGNRGLGNVNYTVENEGEIILNPLFQIEINIVDSKTLEHIPNVKAKLDNKFLPINQTREGSYIIDGLESIEDKKLKLIAKGYVPHFIQWRAYRQYSQYDKVHTADLEPAIMLKLKVKTVTNKAITKIAIMVNGQLTHENSQGHYEIEVSPSLDKIDVRPVVINGHDLDKAYKGKVPLLIYSKQIQVDDKKTERPIEIIFPDYDPEAPLPAPLHHWPTPMFDSLKRYIPTKNSKRSL